MAAQRPVQQEPVVQVLDLALAQDRGAQPEPPAAAKGCELLKAYRRLEAQQRQLRSFTGRAGGGGSGRACEREHSRAAFATADVRRALARLAAERERDLMRHFEGDKAPGRSPVGGVCAPAMGRRAERSGCGGGGGGGGFGARSELAAGQRSAARLARRQARASVAPRPLGPLSGAVVVPATSLEQPQAARPDDRDDARQGAQARQDGAQVEAQVEPREPGRTQRAASSGSEPEKISEIISAERLLSCRGDTAITLAAAPNNQPHLSHHSNLRDSHSAPDSAKTKATSRDHSEDEVAERVAQPEVVAYANGAEEHDDDDEQQVPASVSREQAAKKVKVEFAEFAQGTIESRESHHDDHEESKAAEIPQAAAEAPTDRLQEHPGPSMSSTNSFVPATQQFEQREPDHLTTRHFEPAQQLLSAPHPVGLGFSPAQAQGMMMMASDEPVPSTGDKSIVMTSSISLSPDDEGPAQQFVGGRHAEHLSRLRALGGRGGGACGDSAGSQGALSASGSSSVGGGGNGSGGSAGSNQKQNFLGKFVGKKASRLRELVLQNLGKADRTSDELFDLYETNFYKQQQQVQRLTKEFKLYSTALRSYHEASKSLNKSIQQATGDYQLARHDLVCENLSHLEQLNEDLMEKLHEQVMRTLGVYLSKFEETKEKISKRHRKLIDYDSSRRLYELMLASVNKRRSKLAAAAHQQQIDPTQQQQQNAQNYQSILRGLKFLSQQSQQEVGGPRAQQENIASQLVDEARLLKLREQLNYCKLMYENINGELHEELPIIYEKKMKSLLQALQNYYALKAHYHSNAGKLLNVVSEVIEECPQGLETTLLGGLRAQARRQQDEYAEEDDDDDDDDDEDQDEDDEEADGRDEDSPKANSKAHMVVQSNGGGSSGVGSSRGDSVVDSDSPSGSSPSHSPECVGRALIGGVPREHLHLERGAPPSEGDELNQDQAEGPGKAEGPAGFLASGKQQSAATSSGSVGALPGGSTTCLASGPGEMGAVDRAEQQREALVEELVEVGTGGGAAREVPAANGEASLEPAIESQPETVDGSADGPAAATGEKVDGQPGESKPEEQIEIKILDTTKPVSAKANEHDALGESNNKGQKPGHLYKVKTNYKYLAEDVDELCFEPDEIIQVIEFDENHEPEDGWLLGIREVNNQRGLFPANFTQPI